MRTEQTRLHKLLGTVSSRFALVVLGTLAGIVTARVLQPAGRGTYALVVAIATTALSLGHLSIEQANVFLWHRGIHRRTLVANSVTIGAATGTVAAGAAWLVVMVAPDAFRGLDHTMLVVALLSVPLTMVSLYLYGLVALDDRIGWANRVRIGVATLQVGGIIVAAALGRLTPASVVVIWAVTSSLPVFALLRGFAARPADFVPSVAREAVGVGLRYHFGLAALFLLWRIDMFLLNAEVTRREVGLYALAVSVAELAYLVTDSVALVALPRQVGGSLEEAATFTARVLRLNAVAGLAAVCAISLSSPVIVPLVFGSSFSGSVGPIVALLPGVAALGLIRPLTSLMLRFNRPGIVSLLTSGALVVNVGVNLALIPHLGAVGASLASTVAYGLLAVGYVVWFVRATNTPFFDVVPRVSECRAFLRRAIPVAAKPT